jgi:ParB-like chromosome segregation protein Spo0J
MQDSNPGVRVSQELTINLNEIDADPKLQPRIDGIDLQHVQELEPIHELWPPLIVVRRANRYVLVDGFHRFAAAQNKRLKEVKTAVLEVSDDDDLRALAFALNAGHGAPLTLNDRRAFAARLLRANPDWSDREIGRRSGLVQPTVAKIRHELESQSQIPVTNTRVGRDGRGYDAAQQRRRTITIGDFLDDLAAKLDRSEQRRIVRYLQKLVDLLESQDDLKGFKTIDDAASACRAVLGEEEAKNLADRLGWSSGNILDVALSLGYLAEDRS